MTQDQICVCQMSLPLDMIHEIAQHCDDKTYMNMCLISKDVHKMKKKILSQLESFSLVRKVKNKTIHLSYIESPHTRLKIIHQIMRIIMKHLHILRLPEQTKNLPIILLKLEEFKRDGMSTRKVKEYKSKLLTCF